MALLDIFKNIGIKYQQMRYAKFMNGYTPVFSQFGQSIYASDIVQMCIDIIAAEISKLQPRHIRTDTNGMQTTPKSSLNRLFKFAPNPLMTTRDFLEKVIWLLFMNYNCFIYPTVATVNGITDYTAFYPLNPTRVEFLQDITDRLFVKLYFANGSNYTLLYSDVIHLRKKYSVNDIMGGGANGQPDNAALLKVLEINDTVLQGLGKAIKSSLSIRGILKINTMMDGPKMDEEKAKLEAAIATGETSILPIDLKGDYTPLSLDPKLIDRETLDFLQSKVLNWYGVSVPILTGDFNDDQYQAFYEKALEGIVVSLGQAFSKCLFSQREIDTGNEMIFYQKDMMYLSTKSKLELIKTAGEMGILSDNQKLQILGMAPIKGGERYTQSLNFVDKSIINQYQLNGAKQKPKEDTKNE